MAVGSTAALSQILVMLQALVLARWVGPENNAYVLAAFNVAGLGFILVNWGFDHWLLQQTSLSKEDSHHKFGQVLSVKLLFGSLIAMALLIALPLLRPKIYLPIILGLALLDLLTDSLSASSYTYLYAQDQYKRAAITLTIGRALRLLGTLAMVYFKINTLAWFLVLRFIIDFGILVYLWWVLKPKISIIKPTNLKLITKQTWAFALAELLNFAYDRADLTLLAFLTLQKAEISYYGTATNILVAGISILLPLQYVLIPYIIRRQEQDVQMRGKRTVYLRPLLYLLVAGLLGGLLLYFFGQPIINLTLGEAYSPSGPLLRLASPLILLKAISIALSSFLIAKQRQELKLVPLTVVTFLKVALILIFYRRFGLDAMIIAYILCEFILVLLYLIQLVRSSKGDVLKNEVQSQEAL